MKLVNATAGVCVPDGVPEAQALSRTTALAVVAHQDDMEILGYSAIADAFGRPDRWFSGVVVTNGSGSARAGIYADYTDEDMCRVRRREQEKAAIVGEYGACVFLDYPSSGVKQPAAPGPADDLRQVLEAAAPEVVYTHNPADKHDTHVAVALRTLEAIRSLPLEKRPKRLLGCEVWRDLDWMCDEDKVALRVDTHENLAAALLGVYDSQIAGGKRYDLATMGRRRANATFFASHEVDDTEGITFALDMTPLITDDAMSVADFTASYITRFAQEVDQRIRKFLQP